MNYNRVHREGQLLRIERLRQGKGIKEVAGNICSVSTLSKIERGKQNIDRFMLVDLYKELGITYEDDEMFIKSMEESIEEYFYEKIYNFESKSFITLDVYNEKLNYSPLSLEWMLIKGLEKGKEDILIILDECVEFMDERLLAWYYLIHRHESNEIALEKRIYSHKVLQNSYGTLGLMWEYWRQGEYSSTTNLSSQAINYALDEGNTWSLSQVYSLMGSIYACYNIEDLMVREYQKAINLLKNTNWSYTLEVMYYNIGATYISLGNYQKSREYLSQCDGNNYSGFNLLHKWAVLEIRSGNLDEASLWIKKMEDYVKGFKNDERLNAGWDEYDTSYYDEIIKILEVTKLQASGDPESYPDYISLLESLMKKFLNEARYGFMLFHKDALKEAYIKNRLYKDALTLEEIISSITKKKPVK